MVISTHHLWFQQDKCYMSNLLLLIHANVLNQECNYGMPPATKRIIPDLTGDSPGFTGPSAETNIDLATPKLGGLRSQSYTRPLLTGVPSQLLHHGSRSCTIDSTFTPTFYQGLLWSVVAISLLQPIPATLPRSGVHPRCSPCEKETESPNTWQYAQECPRIQCW